MKITELLNKDIVCSCGRTHRCDIKHVCIGKGVVTEISKLLSDKRSIMLVADKNTYAVCGETVKSLLKDKITSECIFDQDEHLVPDEQTVKTVQSAMKRGTDFVLGIGSGVINDTCKYVSYKAGIKCGIIATAPSMDGFASSGAAMIFDGMKVTFTMHAPELILGDTDILRTAPLNMIASGYADIIGKYSSLCDWKLAALMENEPFCPYIYNIVKESTDETRSLASALMEKDGMALGRLMEILVLVGACLTLNESTRPGSGSEHHLSHYFEITGLINKQPYFLHGTDVGYATVVTAALRERILSIEKPTFSSLSENEREEAYKRIYGKIWGEVAALQKKAARYQKYEKDLYSNKWNKVKEVLSECPSADEITNMLTDVGFDMATFEKQYGKEKIRNGVFWGKDLKDRYSVLWLYYSLFASKKSKGYGISELESILSSVRDSETEKAAEIVKSHKRIFLYGAGRSGLMLKAFAMRLSQAGLTVYAVGDCTTPAIEKGDLLILASASGKTPSVLRCIQTATDVCADVYVITASERSPILEYPCKRVILPAPNKDSGGAAMMGTLFEQALLLYCDEVVEALGKDVSEMRSRHANLE